MIFSLIPARGGSKGIKDKNLSKVGNLSLVLGAIKCAERSGIFDNIVVTSDSLKIKKEIQAQNAEFLRRPKSISTDTASARGVVEHFILSKGLKDDDIIVYMQPTSPFRSSKNIHEAVDIFDREKCPVTSVSEEKLYYEKYLTLDNDKKLQELFINSSSSNRQSLKHALNQMERFIFSINLCLRQQMDFQSMAPVHIL